MKELNSVLHVAGNERTERLTQVKTAAEVALTSLRARFPEAEGYRFKVTDTAPPESGFRREIRGRRGWNWGVYVIFTGTDPKISKIKLAVGRESKLMSILGLTAFLALYAAVSWIVISVLLDAYGKIDLKISDQWVALGALVVIGVPVSALIGIKFVGFILQPTFELKEAAAKEIMEATKAAWTS
jgi:hypothetical protein